MTIFNVDNPEEKIIFSTPIDIPNLKGCSVIQNIGGAQTFARRYLYIMAFEVSEADTVNNGVDPNEELKKQKINNVKRIVINNLIETTNTDLEKYLRVVGFKSVEEITEEAFPECVKLLNKKKEQIEREEAERNAKEVKNKKELGGVL